MPLAPWAADVSESVGNIHEGALGPHSSRILSEWSVSEELMLLRLLPLVPDAFNDWTEVWCG